MASKLRKGGDARYVIAPVAQNDTFQIPRGFKLREFVADTLGTVTTTAPTVVLGVVPAVQQVGTITVAGVAGAASTVFSIGGVASAVQIAISNTVLQTVALILSQFGPGGPQASALLNAGWVITAHPTLTDRVVVTGSPSKTSSAPAIVTTSLTVQTVTAAVATNGSSDATIMTSQTLPTTIYTIKDLSANIVAGKAFLSAGNLDKLVVTFTTTSTSAGYYLVNGVQSPLIASGQTTSQIVTTLATMKIPGYSLSPSSNVLTITNLSSGAGVPQPTFGSYAPQAVTGTTWTSVFTPEDTTVYVAVDLNAVGNANFYAILQKMN